MGVSCASAIIDIFAPWQGQPTRGKSLRSAQRNFPFPGRPLQKDGPVVAEAKRYRLPRAQEVQGFHAHGEHRLWVQQEDALSDEKRLLQVSRAKSSRLRDALDAQ